MKKREKPVNEFSKKVYEFHAMLDSQRYEAAYDSYNKIVAEGLLLILFALERICTGIFILLGVLFALAVHG